MVNKREQLRFSGITDGPSNPNSLQGFPAEIL